MSAEDQVDDTIIDPTEEVDKTEEVEGTDTESETEDKPQYTEFEKKQHERAKLAEAEVKKLKAQLASKTQPQTSQKQEGELSARDIILLSSTGIKESEDLDEVIDFAKFKKLSIADALKNSTLKAILAEKAEVRRTAEATNTGGSKRITTKVTNETMIENAQKGKLPTSDDDIAKLAEATVQGFKKR